MTTDIHHALILNLHQPPGNLQAMLDGPAPWETHEILFAYDRIARAVWGDEDIARIHLSLSGTLLEVLSDPAFQERVYGIVDCGSVLWHLQNEKLFRILGTGYYHPVLPLIPPADRDEHLKRWQGIARHLFWRESFAGFWPPEMGFSMDLIPLLRRWGFRYVIVDSLHVVPKTPMDWAELRYRPHIARHGNDEIVVIVRDRELSDAQESGMEFEWFRRELTERTKWCDFPPLVATATDGENGGWFRNTTTGANFWGAFYRELVDRRRGGDSAVAPAFIDDYLDRFGAHGEVIVRHGAWNTGDHHGVGFVQWTGSERQRQALARVDEASREIHGARGQAGESKLDDPELHRELEEALWRLLRAETSCHFYWGEDWVDRTHADLDAAFDHLRQARERLSA